MKPISTGAFCQETAKLVEAFYELSFLISKAKKVHTEWRGNCKSIFIE
jgi:hypothetical protein